jgi:RNA polymerase sigma-70 factor (ECF subfamily)
MNELTLDFETIHADFRPRILRYLTNLVGEYEAEDLTQEVFTRISLALDSFRGESQLSTWIYRITTNVALDRLRAPAYRHTVQNEQSAIYDLDEIVVAEKDARATEKLLLPEEQVWRKQRFECFRDFVEGLPPNYRTVVVLSELEDFAAGEIADILGLSLDVVKIRLHRGRVRLLQGLKAHCKPEDWL